MAISTALNGRSDSALPALNYAERWLSGLTTALGTADVDALLTILEPSAWFRDLLVFTWDIRSSKGHATIKEYLQDKLPKAKISNVQLDFREGYQPRFDELAPGFKVVDVAFTFETPRALGRGSAKVQMTPPANSDGSGPDQVNGSTLPKAICMMMMLNDWKGYEESGHETVVPAGHTLAWEHLAAQRRAEVERDPTVVIIGSGHTGLQIAARLRQMNIRTLIIEQNARVGDNWRKRYPTLYLHTPRTHHQFLYQPYPSNWPKFTSKDKLGDWLEQYAVMQDLIVWTSSSLMGRPTYDKNNRRWSLVVQKSRDHSQGHVLVELHPPHLIFATSLFGDPRIPIDASSPESPPTTTSPRCKTSPVARIPGLNSFPGPVIHSSAYPGGAPYRSQRVLVIGACNTSVDICQDLVQNEAAGVTMLQRSATAVVSDRLIDVQLSKIFPEGERVEISDFWVAGSCIGMVKEAMVQEDARKARVAFDWDMREGLQKAGFKITDGPDGGGQLIMVYERAQGYFIDVGCAKLIIDGQVKIKQGAEIARVEGSRVCFTDGSEADTDALIFATGFKSSREKLYSILGDEVMDQTEETWGLDDHGELRAGFKPSGYPGLWITAADFANVRFYSKHLALILKAIELGFVSYDQFLRNY